MLNGFRI